MVRTAVLAATCGLFGLAIGSFLNVVIERVPKRQSVVRPRSRCPRCEAPIAERDNIPVVSWLALRGRCRTCHEAIDVRYPLVEATTAGLFVAAALRFPEDWVLPAFCLFFAALLAVSVIDLEHYIVPNRIVYPTLLVSVPALTILALVDDRWSDLKGALIGAVAASGGLLIINLVNPRGMGMGDVKLALVLGLFLGWINLPTVALGLFFGFLLGALGGLVLMLLRRRTRNQHVPFAPFLSAGALLAVLAGNPILHWYLT